MAARKGVAETNWGFLDGKTVLVTGGTGSFGKEFCKTVLRSSRVKKLIVLSRDELKQYEMQRAFDDNPILRFFLGDVRDYQRLLRAFHGVDFVVHAAALKQVPAAEYNPFEFIKTNVLGAQNIVEAAIECGVKRVIALSTDKAANPINLYGATKLCSDKIMIAGNAYLGSRGTTFSVVRYGNVIGSRGSIIPLLENLKKTGEPIPVTDPRMTRFWITLPQGTRFVLQCLEKMTGGEIFIPKIPSMNIMDLVKAIAPNNKVKIVGIRPGEKLHEVMVPEDEARTTLEFPDFFVIQPAFVFSDDKREPRGYLSKGKPVEAGFRYSSDLNKDWLSSSDLKKLSQLED